MADEHGNIMFDDACHQLFAAELREAEVIVRSLVGMLEKCYAEPDHGSADRTRRGLRAARRCLLDVQLAMAALSRAETGSEGPYGDRAPDTGDRTAQPDADRGLGNVRGLHPAFDRPKGEET